MIGFSMMMGVYMVTDFDLWTKMMGWLLPGVAVACATIFIAECIPAVHRSTHFPRRR